MKNKHLAVLREIQDEIPKELLMNLMKKEKQFSTIKTLVEAALKEPDDKVSPKQKRRFQAVLDSGYLEREVDVIDRTVEQQIDDYFKKRIDEEVLAGRLPKHAPKLQLLNNKGKQYARRKREQLRKLFVGEDPHVAPSPENNQEDESEHQTREDDGGILPSPRVDPRE